MPRLSKTVLLMGTALLAVTACSSAKGPGAIGTKDDIIVRNYGIPGTPKAPPPGGDVPEMADVAERRALDIPPGVEGESAAAYQDAETLQSENTQAPVAPAGQDSALQPLPDTAPAFEEAAQAQYETNAPMPSVTTEPVVEARQFAAETADGGFVPAEPVTHQTVTPPTAAELPQAAPAVRPEMTSSYVPDAPVGQMQASPASPYDEAPRQAVPASVTEASAPPDAPPAAQRQASPYVPPPVQQPRASAASVYPAEDYPAGSEPYIPRGQRAQHYEAAQQPAEQPPVYMPDVPAAQPQIPAQANPALSANEPGNIPANAYVPLPAGSAYPLDPDAPYSPSAVAAVTAPSQAAPVAAPEAATAPPPPSSVDLSSPQTIRALQAALKARGAYAGPENGAIDASLLNALTVYQGQNRLPVGGINMDTLRHLGIVQ